jgi:hypothetical protein
MVPVKLSSYLVYAAANQTPTHLFSNPLGMQEDLADVLKAMLDSLCAFTSLGGAQIHLDGTATRFDRRSTALYAAGEFITVCGDEPIGLGMGLITCL